MLLLAAVFWVFSQILQIFVHYIALLSYSNHNHFLDQPDNSWKKNVAPKEKRTTNKIGNENGVMFYNHFHIYALSGYAIGPERVISMLLRWMQLVEFLIKCKYAEDTHDQDTWTCTHTYTLSPAYKARSHKIVVRSKAMYLAEDLNGHSDAEVCCQSIWALKCVNVSQLTWHRNCNIQQMLNVRMLL